MTRLLIPGLSCATVHPGPRSGVLVDGRDFYKALYHACCRAERTILMAGWQFDSKVDLVRGEDAKDCEHPTRLLACLRELCRQRPELEVYMLAWDSSAVFAFERVPLQRLVFKLQGHDRIHYKMDHHHPAGASHHQKLVVVDRSIAFLGGMDVCNARWDDRDHRADAPERCSRRMPYAPYHDVQAFVTGEPVDVLRDWFVERWQLATGEHLDMPSVPRRDIEIRPTLEVRAPAVGLARTWPRMEDPPTAPIKELYELHVRAIGAAERLIYIENQYLSSEEIAHALAARMRSAEAPLEIVIVLPHESKGFKERISIGVYQARILERLGACAAHFGHRLGIYYSAVCGDRGEIPVFVHAKVLAVDDRFLLVSSANTTNRSMGFDSELGIAWESPEPSESLANVRLELLAEHCGLVRPAADALLRPIDQLVVRLDDLARDRRHRLRLHRRNQDEKPGWLLSRLLPEKTPLDPDSPQTMEELLPEPGAWLDRLIRDPFVLFTRHGKPFARRRRRLKL